ncbi:NAD-dependent epimerase/dehydratase family protein [Zunongwangia sp.]|uniref:NAD-dependent epimerase/dehydratase family protein n=1 Tax=Zunongwangia sp. TaxID=1965325 RepID=UPI003AA8279B
MILVTGGTGLVGAHLLYRLASEDREIRAIYRTHSSLHKVLEVFTYYTTTEKAEHLFKKIEWLEADIIDIPQLFLVFPKITEVYHCAALVSFSPRDYRKLRKVNIEGTANVVNLCIDFKVKKLCFVSSIATLGKPISDKKMITEQLNWNPETNHSDYAITKYGAEMEVWRASQEGIKTLIVNPGIIIGPGFWNKASGQLFTRIHHGLNYHFPKVTGFVGVNDVIDAMLKLMNSDNFNDRYILVSENSSFKDVMKYTANSLEKPEPKKDLQKWMIATGWIFQKIGSIFGFKRSITKSDINGLFATSYYDNSKIKSAINFNFTPIEDVIEETGHLFLKDNAK